MNKCFKTLTGLKTSIWHNKCTASWVACVEDKEYNAWSARGLGWRRNKCALAPSHARFISSIDGVPNKSIISSS